MLRDRCTVRFVATARVVTLVGAGRAADIVILCIWPADVSVASAAGRAVRAADIVPVPVRT